MGQITKKTQIVVKRPLKKCDCRKKGSCLTSVCQTFSFTRFTLVSKIIQQNLTQIDRGLIQKPPQQTYHVELSKYTWNLQDKM